MRGARAANLVVAALVATALAACEPRPRRSWIITGGQLVDVVAGVVVPNGAIVVRDGEIAALLAPGDQVPRDLPRIDATGMTILPGLIDNHAHVSGQDRNGTTGVVPTLWATYRSLPYQRNALLEHGVTFVRDPGGRPAVDIRNRANDGEIVSPGIYAAGPYLYAPGGYPENVVEPEILARFVGVSTTTPEGARAFVRDNARLGVDFIKVIYTSGVFLPGEYPPDAPWLDDVPSSWLEEVPILGADVLSAAIDEADRHGLRTAVHLNRFGEARVALDAGAHWIHHNWDVPHTAEGDRFFADMVARGACLDPTLIVHETRAPEMLHGDQVVRAWQAGVPIDAGTDTGFAGADALFGEGLLDEIRLLAEAGLPPVEALRAATIVGAECMGIQDERGSIDLGKKADLVLVRGDPVADLGGLTKEAIRVVFVEGARVKWEEER